MQIYHLLGSKELGFDFTPSFCPHQVDPRNAALDRKFRTAVAVFAATTGHQRPFREL
jgi:hypothetical protein